MEAVNLLLMTLLVRIQVIYCLLQGLDGHLKAGDGLAKVIDGIYKILAFHFRQRFFRPRLYVQGVQIMSSHYHFFYCLYLLFHDAKVQKIFEKSA